MFLHLYLVASFSLQRQVPELLAIPGAWALTNVITGDVHGIPLGVDMKMIISGDPLPKFHQPHLRDLHSQGLDTPPLNPQKTARTADNLQPR